VAEFESLLDKNLVKQIETSISYAAVGAMRRNGTFPAGDNLIVGYTNPQLMGIHTIGWIGDRLKNQTFIDFANKMGNEVFELFTANGSNTFTEYVLSAPKFSRLDAVVWCARKNEFSMNISLTFYLPDTIAQHITEKTRML